MKKAFLFLTLPAALLLSSCTVNWFGETRDVPWYYVAVPDALIAIAGYFILMSKTYVCPHCGTEFKAKPYHLFVAIHMGRKRVAKCPNCKKIGYCEVKR